MGPRKQAKVVSLHFLWPFVLFVSFLGVLYILIIVAAVSPASSAGGTVLECLRIFVLQAVRGPAMAAPVISIMIGFIMAIGILDSGVDRKAMKTASRAVIFGFASLAVYAYLLLIRSGIGR